ncbi:unnamed protein product [Vitrella brassicaformis CCMP3155]|uniref:Uncharacterized protein n=2 Tax=Vitrella brassicaformis TaxID=1169539 RepID=A0A0G4EKT5_VITBC|nr:unnamed protein product [Vitrella brassicaformis CCMP3155]|eukprot:CEL97147.1 unnamed protein product [Vitrella brassicaformis CCMP3155]
MTPHRDELPLSMKAIDLIKAHLPLRDLLTSESSSILFSMLVHLRSAVDAAGLEKGDASCQPMGNSSWSFPFDALAGRWKKRKFFSIKEHGFEEAKQMAIAPRREMERLHYLHVGKGAD